MLTDERIAEIRARRTAVPKRVFYLSVQVVDCTDADHAVLTDCLLRAPADLADLLQHADALAAENRRLRAALAEIARHKTRMGVEPGVILDSQELARRTLGETP